MIIEKIIFSFLAFALFIVIFLKMIQKNDTNYLYLLSIQAFGITMEFIGLIFNLDLPIIVYALIYIFSIIIPIIIILIEKKNINFTEILFISMNKIYNMLGQEEKSRKLLLNLVEKYPQSYYGHKCLAKIYEKMGNHEIASDEYRRTVELNSKDYDSSYKVAESLSNINKKSEAAQILVDLLKKKPDASEASCLLGDILYEQEKFKEAVSIYLEAIKYNPQNYDLYYNLGMVYTRLNDFQSAKEYYEKAAQINSLLYNAKYNIAQIELIYNELEEAEGYFLECVEDNELEEYCYYYLAYISMVKGEEEKAINYLNVAVEQNIELYEKASKETVFKMIMRKINKPSSEAKPRKTKFKKKEMDTILHLEKTYELVENLNNNDIETIRNLKKKRLEKEREM